MLELIIIKPQVFPNPTGTLMIKMVIYLKQR